MTKTSSGKKQRTIFVTVGTTLFEALVQAVTTEKALSWMASKGYTRLIVQYGKGAKPNISSSSSAQPVQVECYDFKPSLASDMNEADLIISHAGAGTVMETLGLKNKRVVVVINTILMHNHQTELANAMGARKHLYVVDAPELLENIETWNELESFEPVPKEPGDEYDFPRLLDSFLGFSPKES